MRLKFQSVKYTYLAIDLGSVLIPFLASFHPVLQFYKKWGSLLPAILLPGLFFVLWDIVFTANGVWGFNPRYITGIYFFNLPLEEVLFFFCIPYACIFSYHCINTLWPGQKISAIVSLMISWSVIPCALFTAILFYRQRYTCITFLLLAIFTWYIRKKPWTGQFYFVYACMLPPFIVVNGLLTGSWIDEHVVWYNSADIFGLRLLTIPIEDIFYGWLLIGFQISLYEFFSSRLSNQWYERINETVSFKTSRDSMNKHT